MSALTYHPLGLHHLVAVKVRHFGPLQRQTKETKSGIQTEGFTFLTTITLAHQNSAL